MSSGRPAHLAAPLARRRHVLRVPVALALRCPRAARRVGIHTRAATTRGAAGAAGLQRPLPDPLVECDLRSGLDRRARMHRPLISLIRLVVPGVGPQQRGALARRHDFVIKTNCFSMTFQEKLL